MKQKIIVIWIINSLIIQLMIATTSMTETVNKPLMLEKPDLRNLGTGFPYAEAGLSVYIQVETLTAIEMNNTLKAFSSILESNSEYTLGNVDNFNIYVSFSGWIIAYLSKNTPSIIFADLLNSYLTCVLKNPINKVLNFINKNGEYKYFHFQYPDANLMIIISDTTSTSNDYLYIELPNEYTYYEASYSIAQSSTSCKGILKVDDNQIKILDSNLKGYGFYDLTTTLRPDVVHIISIENSNTSGTVYGKTAIIYKK